MSRTTPRPIVPSHTLHWSTSSICSPVLHWPSSSIGSHSQVAGKFLDSIGLSAYNTRLFKHPSSSPSGAAGGDDDATAFTIKVASAVAGDGADPTGTLVAKTAAAPLAFEHAGKRSGTLTHAFILRTHSTVVQETISSKCCNVLEVT